MSASALKDRGAGVKTGTDVLPLSSPNKAPKGLLNDLAPIWISLEHDGEEILITPAVTRGSQLCAEQRRDKSAYECWTPVQFNKS